MVTLRHEPDFVIFGHRAPAWTVVDFTGSLLAAFRTKVEAREWATDYLLAEIANTEAQEGHTFAEINALRESLDVVLYG